MTGEASLCAMTIGPYISIDLTDPDLLVGRRHLGLDPLPAACGTTVCDNPLNVLANTNANILGAPKSAPFRNTFGHENRHGFHLDRTAGSHCDHRHSSGHALAGPLEGQIESQTNFLRE